jgi:capsular exopolysaccharide synthesis family protein
MRLSDLGSDGDRRSARQAQPQTNEANGRAAMPWTRTGADAQARDASSEIGLAELLVHLWSFKWVAVVVILVGVVGTVLHVDQVWVQEALATSTLRVRSEGSNDVVRGRGANLDAEVSQMQSEATNEIAQMVLREALRIVERAPGPDSPGDTVAAGAGQSGAPLPADGRLLIDFATRNRVASSTATDDVLEIPGGDIGLLLRILRSAPPASRAELWRISDGGVRSVVKPATIASDGRTERIFVSFEQPDRYVSAALANLLPIAYIAASRRNDLLRSRMHSDRMEDELEDIQKLLQAAETERLTLMAKSLADRRLSDAPSPDTEVSATLERLNALREERTEAMQQAAEVRELARQATSARRAWASRPDLGGVARHLAEIRAELAQKNAVYREGSDVLLALGRREAQLEEVARRQLTERVDLIGRLVAVETGLIESQGVDSGNLDGLRQERQALLGEVDALASSQGIAPEAVEPFRLATRQITESIVTDSLLAQETERLSQQFADLAEAAATGSAEDGAAMLRRTQLGIEIDSLRSRMGATTVEIQSSLLGEDTGIAFDWHTRARPELVQLSSPLPIITFYLAATLLSALIIVALYASLDRRVHTPRHLALRKGNDDLISEVPILRRHERELSRDSSGHWQAPKINPAMNYLAINLQLLAERRGSDQLVFQITSSMPSEGKSTIATLLSTVFASQGNRTCLIGADVYNPSPLIAELAGTDPEGPDDPHPPGLFNICAPGSTLTYESVLVPSPVVSNLTIVRAGTITKGQTSGAIVKSPAFRRFLGMLRDRFDTVIFDSPPVSPVIHAVAMASEIDWTVLVVALGRVTGPALEKARRQLDFAGVRVLGSIANKANRQRDYYGYRGYKYYKYYRSEPVLGPQDEPEQQSAAAPARL